MVSKTQLEKVVNFRTQGEKGKAATQSNHLRKLQIHSPTRLKMKNFQPTCASSPWKLEILLCTESLERNQTKWFLSIYIFVLFWKIFMFLVWKDPIQKKKKKKVAHSLRVSIWRFSFFLCYRITDWENMPLNWKWMTWPISCWRLKRSRIWMNGFTPSTVSCRSVPRGPRRAGGAQSSQTWGWVRARTHLPFFAKCDLCLQFLSAAANCGSPWV